VKIPKPKEGEDDGGTSETTTESETSLPQTLVRIPTEHAPMLQSTNTGGGGSGE
jgi:DASH complex subunit DAD2